MRAGSVRRSTLTPLRPAQLEQRPVGLIDPAIEDPPSKFALSTLLSLRFDVVSSREAPNCALQDGGFIVRQRLRLQSLRASGPGDRLFADDAVRFQDKLFGMSASLLMVCFCARLVGVEACFDRFEVSL